jgi:hypothetical protein
MKSQSDEKETLSRRGFARLAAAALAAIPFASSLAQAQRRRRGARTSGAQAPVQKPQGVAPLRTARGRNEHDTPPPLEIINGSFIVDTEEDFLAGDIVSMGAMTRHHIRPGAANNRIFPAHIKVVDGSGEMLFRLDTKPPAMSGSPHPAEFIKITAVLDGTLTVEMASLLDSGSQTFSITTHNNTSLRPTMSDDKPVGMKRHARRKIGPNGGMPSVNTSITRLIITGRDTNDVLYNLAPIIDLASEGRELRIMIWLEERRA